MMGIPTGVLHFPEELEKKTVTQKLTDDEILRELCSVNGIQYEKLAMEGKAISSVEVFFSGFPRVIPQLDDSFPHLVTLCIIGQDLSLIENIASLTLLEELWLAECKITKLKNLDTLKALRKLFLYGNMIERIEGLTSLGKLEILWLNGNLITNIQGLEKQEYLRELNLAENRIQNIGHSLEQCQQLQVLEMSGNRIDSFQDVTYLARLPQLTDLGFNDPKYASNPICSLCNYTTQVLYHLPALQRLDGHDITIRSYKDLAESTVIKKKMFYNMKLKTLQRRLKNFIRKLTEYRDQYILKALNTKLTILWQIYKQLQQEYQRLSSDETQISTRELVELKMAAIEARITQWEGKCDSIQREYEVYVMRSLETQQSLMARLNLELESGGNIRFEVGSPTDAWFASCHDLMLSRFCAADYKELGIQGVKIHRITKVYNRMLRFRFDEKMNKYYPDKGGSSEETSHREDIMKKKLEYLFWVWDPDLVGQQNEPTRILEEGFLDSESALQLGKHGAVPLTNCLSMSDAARIKQSISKRVGDSCVYQHGQVIIAKAYIGKCERAADTTQLKKAAYPAATSVYRSRTSRPFEKSLRPTSAAILNAAAPALHDARNPSRPCDCGQKQSEWFIFDHELVVPEYIVEFEYVNYVNQKNPFQQFDFTIMEGPAAYTSAAYTHLITDDSDIVNMSPVPEPTNSRLGILTAESLQYHLLLTSSGFDSVTEVNLNNQGITKLTGISLLRSLKTLIVSFNEIASLEELSNMGIEVLDASFNRITTLDRMKSMNSLRVLDVSWNCMRYIRDEFAILRKHAPSLEELNTLHNLWLKASEFRLRVISRLKSLQKLDGRPISEEEATAALRLSAASRISQVHIVSHGRCSATKPRSLSLRSASQVLALQSRHVTESLAQADQLWFNKVTSLCLDGQHLSKLSGMEKLVNLRWASFCDNDIVKLEGLESCSQLEELFLDNNCIYKLEGLGHLTSLTRLSLSDNYIVQFEPYELERLPHLHYLALDHNKIASLSGLQRCKGLIELYLSQNRLSNLRDAFFLKVCTNLMILDLSENPLSGTDNYRMFMIYHLSSLKAFDGQPVDSLEVTQAREVLGGRLTCDFVAERVGHSSFSEIRELDLPSLSLRSVDLGAGDQFSHLRSVNLEHNNLTSLGGLIHLPNLRVLCLNHNKVECITPKADKSTSDYSSERVIPILESLEVLHLGYNGIKDLTSLHISRLTGLKALFLQGNELQTVSGLDGLHDLRELVLDKNKIKMLTEHSFTNQWNLQELHMEENRIRELSHLQPLESLQRLYLGMNRIQDLSELEKLSCHSQLVELSVISCPVARRLMHRPLLVYRMPSLAVIDGIPVTEEEQLKASLYYMQQEQQQAMMADSGQVLPGINPAMAMVKGQVPVKVTNVSLGSFSERTPWSGTLQFDPSLLAAPDDRGRSKKGVQPSQGRGQFNIQSSYTTNPQGKSYYSDLHNSSNPFARSNKK